MKVSRQLVDLSPVQSVMDREFSIPMCLPKTFSSMCYIRIVDER